MTKREELMSDVSSHRDDPGMSDGAVKRGTGKSWGELFAVLDAWGATYRTHAEIAVYAKQAPGINGWWAQTVTVGYERPRGMRDLHERTGGYSVNVSRTFTAPIVLLFASVADGDQRAEWLEPASIRVRSLTRNKAWRCAMVVDDSRVELRFTAKSPDKTPSHSSKRISHPKVTLRAGAPTGSNDSGSWQSERRTIDKWLRKARCRFHNVR